MVIVYIESVSREFGIRLLLSAGARLHWRRLSVVLRAIQPLLVISESVHVVSTLVTLKYLRPGSLVSLWKTSMQYLPANGNINTTRRFWLALPTFLFVLNKCIFCSFRLLCGCRRKLSYVRRVFANPFSVLRHSISRTIDGNQARQATDLHECRVRHLRGTHEQVCPDDRK